MGSFPLTADKGPQVVKADKKEEMVPMFFPGGKDGKEDVRLALPSGVMIFKPGVQMVPVSLKNHIWLKAHKVVEVPAGSVGAPKKEKMEQYAEFFRLHGYKVEDGAAAEDKLSRMKPDEVDGFLSDFEQNYAAEKVKNDKAMEEAIARNKQRSDLNVVLQKMTKAELVVYGKQNYKLDLDDSAKKDELIEAILEAADAAGKG